MPSLFDILRNEFQYDVNSASKLGLEAFGRGLEIWIWSGFSGEFPDSKEEVSLLASIAIPEGPERSIREFSGTPSCESLLISFMRSATNSQP